MEQFSFFSQAEADALRAQARELYDPERIHDLSGSDIDQEPLTLAKRHIVQAQLGRTHYPDPAAAGNLAAIRYGRSVYRQPALWRAA